MLMQHYFIITLLDMLLSHNMSYTSATEAVAGTSTGGAHPTYPTLPVEKGHEDFNEPSAANKPCCPCLPGNDDEEDGDETLEELLYDLYSEYYRLELNATLALAEAQVHAQIDMADEIGKQVQV